MTVKLTALVSAAALALTLTACSTDEEPPTTTPTSEGAAPTSENPEPTTEEPEPTSEEPTAGDEETVDMPDTVEDYAETFLSAVQGGDTSLALRLGPADGFAGVELWEGLTVGPAEAEDRDETTWVTLPVEEGGHLDLTVDRSVVESGHDHAITSVVFVQE